MKYASNFALNTNWKLLLNDLGINIEDALSLASLPLDLFNRKDASLTPVQYFNFWHAIEQLAGINDLPLKIGQMITVELFDPAIFACICSPNFNIAIQRLSEFKRLIGPMQLQVAIDNDTTTLELKFYNVSTPTPQSLAMSELVFFAQLARICTRHQVIPLKVTLPDLPNNPAEYKTFFGVLPQKSEHISIVFSRQDAERPFLTANPTMWSFFEPNLQRSLIQLDEDATVSEKVKAILLENLPAGLCTIEDVAQRLAMSKRTLQRLLLEEQTNFKTLLDATRQSLAQHYLEKSSMSTGEISFLLGFQEHNSFNRAFKNWTGNTPQEYRLMH